MPLLLDTGVIYALADRSDAWHARSVALVSRSRETLLVVAPVIPEACYLLRDRLGPAAELAFAKSLSRTELSVEALKAADYTRTVQVMTDYPDIGFVDASIVAVAERLELRTLATTDRRHFGTIRPRHTPAFLLVP